MFSKTSATFATVIVLALISAVWLFLHHDWNAAARARFDEMQKLPPKPQPTALVDYNVKCGTRLGRGDTHVHKFFDSIVNTTHLDVAVAEYNQLQREQPSVEVELRLALVALLQLDSERCLQHVDAALRIDGFNELAHGYRGYCYEIVGSNADAKVQPLVFWGHV
jgi:hypothetical protein